MGLGLGSRRGALTVAWGITLGIASGIGCSHARPSSPDQPALPQVTEYHLHKLIPYTLRVRRPSYAGVDPKAGPGGTDYRGAATPDAHYDCREASRLFAEVKLKELRACLASDKLTKAFYRLKRLAVPYLELEAESDTPACLQKLLPTIPVPREIFFQSTEGDRLACYSSRLRIESDEIAGFKMPMDRVGVRLDFPLMSPPKDDPETVMLLMTWAMTPFWEKNTIAARLVPERICSVCLGEHTMLRPTDPEPVLWPAD